MRSQANGYSIISTMSNFEGRGHHGVFQEHKQKRHDLLCGVMCLGEGHCWVELSEFRSREQLSLIEPEQKHGGEKQHTVLGINNFTLQEGDMSFYTWWTDWFFHICISGTHFILHLSSTASQKRIILRSLPNSVESIHMGNYQLLLNKDLHFQILLFHK